MNYNKYVDISLIKLSNTYDCVLTEIKTYKQNKKYGTIRLTIYKYDKDGNKKQYKNIEVKNKRDLLLKLKEMI